MEVKKIWLIFMAGLLFLFAGTRVFAEDPSVDSIGERYEISQKLLNISKPVSKNEEADLSLVEGWEERLESSMDLFNKTAKGKLPAEAFVIYPEYLSDKEKKTWERQFKDVDFSVSGAVEIPLPGKARKFSGSTERALKDSMLNYHYTVSKKISEDLLNFLLARSGKIVAAAPKEKEAGEPKKNIGSSNLKSVPLTKKRTVIELLNIAREINPKVENDRAYVDVLTSFFQLLGEVETEDTAAVYDMLIEEVYYRLIEKSAEAYRTEHNKIAEMVKGGAGKGISVSEISYEKVAEIIAGEKSDASFKAAAEQYISIIRKSEMEKNDAVRKLETAVHRSLQSGISAAAGVEEANVSKYNSLIWRITNHYATVEKGMTQYDEISGLLKILADAENISVSDPTVAGTDLPVENNKGLDSQISKHEKLLEEYQMRLRKARIERNSEEMEKNLGHIEYEVGLLESLRIRKVELSIDYLDNNYRIFERQIDKYLSTGTLLPPEVTVKYQKSFDKVREKYEEIFKERNDFSKKRRYKEYLDLERRMGKISSDVEIIYDRLAGEVEKQIEESKSASDDPYGSDSPKGPTRRMIPDKPESGETRRGGNEENTFPFF